MPEDKGEEDSWSDGNTSVEIKQAKAGFACSVIPFLGRSGLFHRLVLSCRAVSYGLLACCMVGDGPDCTP